MVFAACLTLAVQDFHGFDFDRGRYAFTRFLGDELGSRREEVTLDVVRKINEDFRNFGQWMKANWANHPENPRNKKKAAAVGGTDAAGASRGDYDDNCGHRGASSNSGGTSSYRDDLKPVDHRWEQPSPWGGVNPTTGPPTISNAAIDVGGNCVEHGHTSNVENLDD